MSLLLRPSSASGSAVTFFHKSLTALTITDPCVCSFHSTKKQPACQLSKTVPLRPRLVCTCKPVFFWVYLYFCMNISITDLFSLLYHPPSLLTYENFNFTFNSSWSGTKKPGVQSYKLKNYFSLQFRRCNHQYVQLFFSLNNLPVQSRFVNSKNYYTFI